MVKYICYFSMLSSQFLIRLKRLFAKSGYVLERLSEETEIFSSLTEESPSSFLTFASQDFIYASALSSAQEFGTLKVFILFFGLKEYIILNIR